MAAYNMQKLVGDLQELVWSETVKAFSISEMVLIFQRGKPLSKYPVKIK